MPYPCMRLVAADGRHSDAVSRSKPVARRRTARVHADLTGTDQAVHMTPRHAFEACDQEVVEALALGFRIDGLDLYGAFSVPDGIVRH